MNTLWPIAREHGAPYRLLARCDRCDGTGTAELTPGKFDTCEPCEGTGEIEVDPVEVREHADA